VEIGRGRIFTTKIHEKTRKEEKKNFTTEEYGVNTELHGEKRK